MTETDIPPNDRDSPERRRPAHRWVLFAFLLCLRALPSSADALSTNVDLVATAAAEAVRSALADFDSLGSQLAAGRRLHLHPQDDHDANWLVEYVLLQELLSRGFTVRLDSAAAGSSSVELSYRIVELVMSGSSSLFGGEVERLCRLTLVLRVTSDMELQWQAEASSEIADRIPKSRLEALKSSTYSFADTKVEEKNLGKFVEPVILSTVLGSLVYVFFSNR